MCCLNRAVRPGETCSWHWKVLYTLPQDKGDQDRISLTYNSELLIQYSGAKISQKLSE